MKNFFRKTLFVFLIVFSALPLFPQEMPISSKSSVDWTQKLFSSTIQLDMEKANIPMPSGKSSAVNTINTRLPNLIKDPLLTLYVDAGKRLGDYVLERDIGLEEVNQIVNNGHKTLGYFDNEQFLLNVRHKVNMHQVSSLFVRHTEPYSRKKSIDKISSRAYTGIIIDARGRIPVHGEFIEERANPCFFPRVWNENMEVVYERNMMERDLQKAIGECAYDWSDDESRYRDRVGHDPLRISARELFGRNRTDLIISNDDALRIFSVPENASLLRQGKIVLLLDKDLLVYDVASPVKDEPYYTALRNVQRYPLKTPGPDTIVDGGGEIRLTYNLKFVANSPDLLPEEAARIAELAELLKTALSENDFTIFVAGHTADIGQPQNQMILSVNRTQTIIRLLTEQGINPSLFSYRGYGETMPIRENTTPEGRAENRRVEIELRPRTTYIQRSW